MRLLGPGEVPCLARKKLCRMSCCGRCNGAAGVTVRMSVANGWRGCGGLAVGLVSARKVSSLPGAGGAAMRASRARESSPRRVSWVARLARWSGVGWLPAGGGERCALWLGAVLAARGKVLPSAFEKFGETFEQVRFWNSCRVGRAVEQHPGEEQPQFPSPFVVETIVVGG